MDFGVAYFPTHDGIHPAELARFRDAGVRRVLHWLPSGPRGPIETALDRWETAIGAVTDG